MSKKSIYCCNVSLDASRFSIGHENGFQIWDFPSPKHSREDLTLAWAHVNLFPLKVAAPFLRSNIVALVGQHTKLRSSRTVCLWDETKSRITQEFDLSSEILNILSRKDVFVIVLKKLVLLYELSNFSQTPDLWWDTVDNEAGLVALSSAEDFAIAVLSSKDGEIKVSTDYRKGIEKSIVCFPNMQVGAMALNADGSKLATSGKDGLEVKIYETRYGNCLFTFRRGVNIATPRTLHFSPDSNWVCFATDRPTIHIFGWKKAPASDSLVSANASAGWFSMFKLVNEGAFAKINLNENDAKAGVYASFSNSQNNIIHVVSLSGKFAMYSFNVETGVVDLLKEKEFF